MPSLEDSNFLPRLREELRSGTVGWSTAELLARHVTVDSELEWLERARRTTVRELRTLLASGEVEEQDEDEPTCKLTATATREDGWMLECARKVAESVVGPMSADRLLQCLLAEGCSTLLEIVPDAAGSGLYDIEAEELCESRGLPPLFDPRAACLAMGVACSSSEVPEVLDSKIRNWCSELSERDLALGIVAESARKAEIWRRLGFASESQYVRERVGVSLASLKAKRLLAARTVRIPELASALASGRIGYEAAYLLSRVATAPTVEEWLRRAERRTVKHLREEVDAVELLIRLRQGRDQRPLDEESLDELFEFERCIVSGDWVEAPTGGQMSGTVSVRRRFRKFGRVTLRWLVKENTRCFFRALERVFGRVSTRVCRVPASFLRFLCENFCRTWLPVLRRARCTESGEQPEYFDVYRRDVFRCSSPVCTRRDLTPHHLLFRSRGGGDDDENVASLCVWCHLHGVHAAPSPAGSGAA